MKIGLLAQDFITWGGGVDFLWSVLDSLLATPRGEAQRIRDFLGLPLELEAMARQVEPSLHRQRRRE